MALQADSSRRRSFVFFLFLSGREKTEDVAFVGCGGVCCADWPHFSNLRSEPPPRGASHYAIKKSSGQVQAAAVVVLDT